jgi:hypothetical protein
MAYSNASLYIKFAGNFKVGLFSDFISSLGIERNRELKVLSVIFWNSVGRQSRLNQLMRL